MTDEPTEEEESPFLVEVETPDIESLWLSDGDCCILDRAAFIEALGNPHIVKVTGTQLWVYWYDEGKWTFAEIKGSERKPKAATVTALRKPKE